MNRTTNNQKPAAAQGGAAPLSKSARRRRRAQARARNEKLAERFDTAPVSQSRRITTRPPQLRSTRSQDGRVVVSHKEFISDVVGPSNTAYHNLFILPVNPGMVESFPWLHAIASRFESYRFQSLEFIYEPACATTDVGKVMLAIDFDAEDEAPLDKATIMSYKGAQSFAPWQEGKLVAHQIDMKKLSGEKYTRTEEISSDLKTYDTGNLIVAAQGVLNHALGELYVRYTVELITPQMEVEHSSAKLDNASAIKEGWFNNSTTAVWGSAVATVTDAFGSFPNNDIIIKDPGQYLLNMTLVGSGISGANVATVIRQGAAQIVNEAWNLNSGQTQFDHIKTIKVTEPHTILGFSDLSCTSISHVIFRLSDYVFDYS